MSVPEPDVTKFGVEGGGAGWNMFDGGHASRRSAGHAHVVFVPATQHKITGGALRADLGS